MPFSVAKDKTRINVVIPDKYLEGLKILSTQRGCSYSQLVREGIVLLFKDAKAKKDA